MQYWIDAELNLQLPYDDYDGESDTYIYVVKCNEKFDNTTDYNKAFMLEYLGDGDEIKSSDLETGTANIGGNKYYYSIYELDKNPTFMIASTYKCGYYISILINPGSGDLDCAQDILACFS